MTKKFIHNVNIKSKVKNNQIKKQSLIPSDKQIRELLNGSKNLKLEKKELELASNNVLSNILNSSKSLENYNEIKTQLGFLYDNLKGIFDFAKVPMEYRDRKFINKTGCAISPANAITSINDVFRVSGFIRAIDLAIKDLRVTFKNKPLHILYPACGPLAPLLLPLLVYYNSNNIYSFKDIKITFIDIQQGSIIALVNLIKILQLDSYIKDIKCIDAVDYKTDEDIHLVILEAMQHGFTREGHLSIAKHFSNMLHKDGIFLPQNITISSFLAIAQEEFNTQFKDKEFASSFTKDQKIQNKRIQLGKILEVNLDSLKNMKVIELDTNTKLIKCSTHTIPYFKENEKQYIMLFATNIHIYKNEYIDEYDSGITHPLPDLNICINFIPKNDKRETDLYIKSSDEITFYYKLIGIPGFLVTKGSNNE